MVGAARLCHTRAQPAPSSCSKTCPTAYSHQSLIIEINKLPFLRDAYWLRCLAELLAAMPANARVRHLRFRFRSYEHGPGGTRQRGSAIKYSPLSTLVAGARKIRLESLGAGNPIRSPVGLRSCACTAGVVMLYDAEGTRCCSHPRRLQQAFNTDLCIAATASSCAIGQSGQAAGNARTRPSRTVCPSS